MLLHRDVGEVHVGVVEVVVGVLHGAEASEARAVDVGLQRAVGGDQHVEAEVKLLATDQQRVVDVVGNHVAVLGGRAALLPSPAVRPFLDLGELVDQEYAGALRAAGRLHDPGGGRAAPELLNEEAVVSRQRVRRRHEVKLRQPTRASASSHLPSVGH